MYKNPNPPLKTILLLALPASGKSEVRKYLSSLDPVECQNEFHIGQTVQLDDFPYVHLMRQIDEELTRLNEKRIFFSQADQPFQNGKDWGTLIELLNEDYQDLILHKTYKPQSYARDFFARLERAAQAVGIQPRLCLLSDTLLASLSKALEKEAQAQLEEKNKVSIQDITDKTVLIEFARGGPQGSAMPLPSPYGYQYSLNLLSDVLLAQAKILFIWVTPKESRRKNQERSNPLDPGSILHHGVPHEVMIKEYGCDDFEYLESQSPIPQTIQLKKQGKLYSLPFARFDNCEDKTSFIRNDKNTWKQNEIDVLHQELKKAFSSLTQRSFENMN